jgi:hypothetical protein
MILCYEKKITAIRCVIKNLIFFLLLRFAMVLDGPCSLLSLNGSIQFDQNPLSLESSD